MQENLRGLSSSYILLWLLLTLNSNKIQFDNRVLKVESELDLYNKKDFNNTGAEFSLKLAKSDSNNRKYKQNLKL